MSDNVQLNKERQDYRRMEDLAFQHALRLIMSVEYPELSEAEAVAFFRMAAEAKRLSGIYVAQSIHKREAVDG